MNAAGEHFRRNLLRLRTKRSNKAERLTQAELASKVGVHRNYVGMLERGERKPSLEMVDAFARVLDVEPHQLLMPPEGPDDN